MKSGYNTKMYCPSASGRQSSRSLQRGKIISSSLQFSHLSVAKLFKMWQIPVKTVPFFTQFLLAIIWTGTPLVNSEAPMDYFENFLTTTEISFAHIPKDNSNDNTASGQWTRLYKCESGSFISSQFWLFNSSTGNLLGLGAACKKVTVDRPSANEIEAVTIPPKMINDASVRRFGFINEQNELAVGFSMRSTTEEKYASIEARELIINGKEPRKCPDDDSNCRLHQFRCKSNFALCGFQAKVMGGNGTFGGSITKLRFHCCYVCNAEPFEVRYFWNISSVENPKSYHHHGLYGYSAKDEPTTRYGGGNNTSPPVYYSEKSCGLSSDYEDYGDYGDLVGPSTIECETSKVVEITGNIDTSANTWESIAHRLFQDLEHRSAAEKRTRRNIHRATETPPERREKTSEIARFLRKLQDTTLVETVGIEDDSKNSIQTECFVCERGQTCTVRQTVWNCEGHYLQNPAVLVTAMLQSSNMNNGISENGWITAVNISNVDPTATDLRVIECTEGRFIRYPARSRTKRSISEFIQETDLHCARIGAQRPVPIGFRLSGVINATNYVYQPLYFRTAAAPSCAEGDNNQDREVFCPLEHAVCGLKYKTQTQNGTDILSFSFKCCYYCIPEEHMHTVGTTRNDGDGPQTFQFHLHHDHNSSSKAHVLEMFAGWFADKSVTGFDWTGQDVMGLGERQLHHHTYECPAGHMCTARQLIGRCDRYVIPTTSYTVESTPLRNSKNMLKTRVKFQEGGHPHFIFSYGSKGEKSELLCPVGSVATGMRVKSELGLGMTGLEMECSHLKAQHRVEHYTSSKTLKAELSTETGRWADEGASFSAPIRGFRFNWSKGKEAAEGLKVSFGPLVEPEDAHPGDEAKFCPDHQAICGFSYWTDIKSKTIKELSLKCCPHCIPKKKWEPLFEPNNDSHEENIGPLAVKVGLIDMYSPREHREIDFETRSTLQTLFSLSFRHAVYWNRANFNDPASIFVSRPSCSGHNTGGRSKGLCKFWQHVVTCGRYKVYTARVKGAPKGM